MKSFLTSLLLLLSLSSFGQQLITPGGALADTIAHGHFGAVTVMQKPGADGINAYRALERGEGRFLLASTSNLIVSPLVHEKYPYNPSVDFDIVMYVGHAPQILVSKKGKYASIDEMMESKKTISLGGFGTQSVCSYIAKLLEAKYSREIIYVPYKAGNILYMDTTSGVLDFSCQTSDTIDTFVASGKWDVLANLGTGMLEYPRIKGVPIIDVNFYLLSRKGDTEALEILKNIELEKPKTARYQLVFSTTSAKATFQKENEFWKKALK